MKGSKLVVLGLLVLGLALVPLFRGRPASLDWHHSYEPAFAQAKASHRPVMAFLYTDWCGYCRQMDSDTFADSSVIETLGEAFVWLRLNPESNPDGARLQRRHGVNGYPTLLILDSEAREISRIPGFVPPDRFLEAVQSRLTLAR
jgi:thiol:disulfide interchange protein